MCFQQVSVTTLRICRHNVGTRCLHAPKPLSWLDYLGARSRVGNVNVLIVLSYLLSCLGHAQFGRLQAGSRLYLFAFATRNNFLANRKAREGGGAPRGDPRPPRGHWRALRPRQGVSEAVVGRSRLAPRAARAGASPAAGRRRGRAGGAPRRFGVVRGVAIGTESRVESKGRPRGVTVLGTIGVPSAKTEIVKGEGSLCAGSRYTLPFFKGCCVCSVTPHPSHPSQGSPINGLGVKRGEGCEPRTCSKILQCGSCTAVGEG